MSLVTSATLAWRIARLNVWRAGETAEFRLITLIVSGAYVVRNSAPGEQ